MKGLFSLGIACVLFFTGLQAVEGESNLTNGLLTGKRHHRPCFPGQHRPDRHEEPCIDPCKGTKCTSYISAYTPTDSSQSIDPGLSNIPISFSNILSGPVGINPVPSAGPFTQFSIQCPGVYLIGWTLTGSSDSGMVKDDGSVDVILTDLTAGSDIQPSPFASFSQNNTVSASGQTIVTFQEGGHVIQLQVSVNGDRITGCTEVIIGPTLFIEQIACLPPGCQDEKEWVANKANSAKGNGCNCN